LYADHVLQLAGYANGEFIGADDVIDQDATDYLHAANGIALLHLTDTDWELVEIKITPEIWGAFNAMVAFAHWQEQNTMIDGLVKGRYTE